MGRSLIRILAFACLAGLLATPAWAQGALPGTSISGTPTPYGKVISSGSTIINGVRAADTLFVPVAVGSQRELMVGQIAPPGGYTIIAPHFLSTMLCDCTGGLTRDSTQATPIPPGFTHLGLRGNIRVGGMGFGSATTQDSAYAGVFLLRYLISTSASSDTLSAATWISKTTKDTLGSLGSPSIRTAAQPAEAWDSMRQLLVYNNGTDGAVGGSSPGIQINRPVVFELAIGQDRIYAGNFAVGVEHKASYIDTTPAVAAAGAGFPFSFDFDLVGWR